MTPHRMSEEPSISSPPIHAEHCRKSLMSAPPPSSPRLDQSRPFVRRNAVLPPTDFMFRITAPLHSLRARTPTLQCTHAQPSTPRAHCERSVIPRDSPPGANLFDGASSRLGIGALVERGTPGSRLILGKTHGRGLSGSSVAATESRTTRSSDCSPSIEIADSTASTAAASRSSARATCSDSTCARLPTSVNPNNRSEVAWNIGSSRYHAESAGLNSPSAERTAVSMHIQQSWAAVNSSVSVGSSGVSASIARSRSKSIDDVTPSANSSAASTASLSIATAGFSPTARLHSK